MLDIPFAFKRVDAMLYIANFDTELEYLRKFFETLEEIQMSDHDFVLDSETAENLVASTPPVVSNTVTGLPPTRKNKSNVWDFFTLEPGLEKKARCNYCGSVLKCNNGTSSMRAHANNCKSNPHSEASKRLKSTSSSMSNMTSPSLPKFDQEKCREAVVKMVVAMELPYRHVEHTAFRECMSILQPKFAPISRSTVARDALLLWDTEKTKLKYFLSHHCRSACLTTDSWTSCQNMSYMCITAHFVDNNWTLHKKILSFPQVTSYSGDSIALEVSECLNEWGLNRVMTVTVDNASANDRGIEILKMMLKLRNGLVLNGDHIHMRCCTHILNLIVKEGLKEIDDSVLRIRGAVKYARTSPSRQRKFLQYVKNRNIEYKGSVQFDRETRWNLTYDMLNAALKLQAAFLELEVKDTKYHEELNKGKGVPTTLDWQNACGISKFLEIFKNATVRISGSSYVTSNRYMPEVFSIGLTLKKMMTSTIGLTLKKMMTSTDVDSTTRDMAKRMKEKYDKYWGNHKSLNMLLLIAFVLDPSYKMKFAHWFIEQNFDALEADELKQNLELCLNNIYEEYSGGVGGTQSNFQPTQFDGLGEDPKYYYIQFLQSTGAMPSASKSELSKYLSEDLENSSTGFNILNWWKVNSSRLPILASIARDVLAIPVSTVASESAFSTGGRVIDEYRSRLTPKTVEALICTEDWLNGSPLPLPSQEDIEEIESFEQEMFSLNLDGGASSTHTTLHED